MNETQEVSWRLALEFRGGCCYGYLMTSDLARRFGAHMQISKREVLVPAGHGIAQHMQHLATTACGRELPTTLVTRSWSRVRCPDCLEAAPSPAVAER